MMQLPALALGAAAVAPVLRDLGVIVSDPAACIRDPTQVLRAHDGTWHFFATRNPECTDHREFPRATVDHYFSANLSGGWSTSGPAVRPSGGSEFDGWSVFTPGAILYDGVWHLWYGAVADGGRPTRESIGLATAPSPFGPWTKSAHNPVFDGNATAWCGAGSSARVDEADAYVVQEQAVVIVKGVCNNFTALPTAWVSQGGAGFGPPYRMLPAAAPMISAGATAKRKGFEQARLFPGPDGLLHMTGHNHGDPGCPHWVSASGGLDAGDWRALPTMAEFGLPSHEPTPVYAGVPGDRGGVPTHFIQFDRESPEQKLAIHLMAVEWR